MLVFSRRFINCWKICIFNFPHHFLFDGTLNRYSVCTSKEPYSIGVSATINRQRTFQAHIFWIETLLHEIFSNFHLWKDHLSNLRGDFHWNLKAHQLLYSYFLLECKPANIFWWEMAYYSYSEHCEASKVSLRLFSSCRFVSSHS